MKTVLYLYLLVATLDAGEQALSGRVETPPVASAAQPLGAEGKVGSFHALSHRGIIPGPDAAEDVSAIGHRAFAWIQPGQLLGSLITREPIQDARGQRVPPGEFTLRLALQPLLKDHLGTSEHREFAVLLPATRDPGTPFLTSQAILDEARRLSRGAHPIVFPIALEKGDPSTLTSFVPQGGAWLLLVASPSRWRGRTQTWPASYPDRVRTDLSRYRAHATQCRCPW